MRRRRNKPRGNRPLGGKADGKFHSGTLRERAGRRRDFRDFSMNPIAEHFEKLSPRYKQHFTERRAGTNFNFRKRLELACELAAGSSGRFLDGACGTGEITCAL